MFLKSRLKGNQLFPQNHHFILHLAGHLEVSSRPVEGIFESIQIDGFGDKIEDPEMDGINCRVERTVAGKHNDGRALFQFADLADELDS